MIGTRSLCRITLGTIAIFVSSLFIDEPALANGACRSELFDETRHTVCSFDLATSNLRLFWRDVSKRPYRSFSALAEAMEKDGDVLSFAMNAGMFQADFAPVGLYVEHGQELRGLNKMDSPAGVHPIPNFYKKPNGVFYVRGREAGVLTTDQFLQVRPKADYATQSGPMLVINDELHPAFIKGSSDRTRRTGVCVTEPGKVNFAISDDPINFYDFARFFRNHLGCSNALFLDGGNGAGLYAPELARNDASWHGGFGPIFGVVEPR